MQRGRQEMSAMLHVSHRLACRRREHQHHFPAELTSKLAAKTVLGPVQASASLSLLI
jgi:hypothetical protein